MTCKYCNKTFKGGSGYRYCSLECRDKAKADRPRHKPPRATCNRCGEEMTYQRKGVGICARCANIVKEVDKWKRGVYGSIDKEA